MPRPRSAATTRAAILAAARVRFGENGYDRTTLRGVAADAGVDPAMVIRYFGSKEGLFGEASRLEVRFPDLSGIAVEDLSTELMANFFRVWEDEQNFLPLLRAAASDEAAARAMSEVFRDQVAPALSSLVPDAPAERASLVGALVLGLAMSRYVLRTPPLAGMSRAEVVAWVDPVLRSYLFGAAASAAAVGDVRRDRSRPESA